MTRLTPEREKEIKHWMDNGGDLRKVGLFIRDLLSEIDALKKIIAKELSENDELGCEYTYVKFLKEENASLKKQTDNLKEVLGTIADRQKHGSINETERDMSISQGLAGNTPQTIALLRLALRARMALDKIGL